jgi:hypothetical protein
LILVTGARGWSCQAQATMNETIRDAEFELLIQVSDS